MQSPNIQFSVAPDYVASEIYATGTGPDVDPALTSTKANTTLRESFGRVGMGITHDPVKDTSHLSDLAQADLDDRDSMYFKPGPGMIPVPDADWDDFSTGDLVTFTHDAGLGQQTGTYKVGKRKLTVGEKGQEQISVEFV